MYGELLLRTRLGQGKYLCVVKSYAHGWRLRLLSVHQVVGMKNRPRWKVKEYWFEVRVLVRLPNAEFR